MPAVSACPDPKVLQQLLLGQLSPALAANLERHVEHCPNCGKVLPTLLMDDSLVQAMRGRDASKLGSIRSMVESLIPKLHKLQPEHPPVVAPTGVAGYEIIGELGRGGMGVVYEARHIRLKRRVALKMLLSGSLAGSAELARFRSEAEAVARLHHPHIVQIYEIGDHNGLPFFSLEFVSGGNLGRRLAKGLLPVRQAAELLEQLARAVEYAHGQKVVHRDLKPANILLETQGAPPGSLGIAKITDFGLAKQLDSSDGQTKTEAVLGTPSYMAPEQAQSMKKDIGPATDVYALGAILYECLTGRPPFRGETALETMVQVAADEPVPPRKINNQVPRDLEIICQKCLRKEPGKRYVRACDLADDLARFLRSEPIRARPVGRVERAFKWAKRRPAWAAVIVLLLLLPLTGAIVWKFRPGGGDNSPINADAQNYAEQIVQADFKYLHGEVNDAEKILAQCSPKLRGWEWDYLHRLCNWGMRRKLSEFGGPVRQVAFGRNSQLAVVADSPGIQVRNATSGDLVIALGKQHGPVNAVAFSPDGKQLAAVGNDRMLRVYDAATGHELAVRDHGGRLQCVAFSPDGHWLAAGGGEKGNGILWLWSTPLGKEPARKCAFHKQPVLSVTFFYDSTSFASMDQGPDGDPTGGEIHGWLSSGGDRPPLANAGRYQGLFFVPSALRWPPSAGLLSRDGRVGFWVPPNVMGTDYTDTLTRKPGGMQLNNGNGGMKWEEKLDDQPDPRSESRALDAAYNSDMSMLALAGGWPDQGKVRVYRDARMERLLGSVIFFGHSRQICSVSLSLDQPLLATGSSDGTVCVWDPTIRRFDTPIGMFPATSVAFSADSHRLATLDGDHITVWELENGRKTVGPRVTEAVNSGGALAPRGAGFVLAIAMPQHPSIQLIDPENREKPTTVGDESSWSGPILSPNGEHMAALTKDGVLGLWSVGSRQRLLTSPGPGTISFSSDSRCLIRTAGQKGLEIWDARTGQPMDLRLPPQASRGPVQFAADLKLLALPLDNGQILLWNAGAGRRVATLRSDGRTVGSLAFSTDGRRLFTAGKEDAAVKVWDTANGVEICTLHHAKGSQGQLLLSPDGRRLAMRSNGGTFVWDATPVPPEVSRVAAN